MLTLVMVEDGGGLGIVYLSKTSPVAIVFTLFLLLRGKP